jgi:hypothetical protein
VSSQIIAIMAIEASLLLDSTAKSQNGNENGYDCTHQFHSVHAHSTNLQMTDFSQRWQTYIEELHCPTAFRLLMTAGK